MEHNTDKITPEVIAYKHLNNIGESSQNLEAMGKKKFGDKFIGYLRVITFIHNQGFVTRKIEPIEGSPVKAFRKSIEESGLSDFSFQFPDLSGSYKEEK